jgi:hypothetical protein
MVSSIGEAANRSASAQRRTADLVGISPTARLDGNTELAAFRRGRQRGPGRSIPPVKLRSKTSSALRTTVEPIVGWRTGRKGEPAPKRFGAAEKATLDDLAERRRADRGVSAPRRARRCEWTPRGGVRMPSSKRMPALKCFAPTRRRPPRVARSATPEVQDVTTLRPARTRCAGPEVVVQRESPTQRVSTLR